MKKRNKIFLTGLIAACMAGWSMMAVASVKFGGEVATEYAYKDWSKPNKHSGGNFYLDYFGINFHGKKGNLTWGADGRFSNDNFNESGSGSAMQLHYGWAAYSFGTGQMDQKLKVGYFRIPFGNLPYGYQTFWGNLTWYAGLTDNQSAGAGYTAKHGAWRFDADVVKNTRLSQPSTYGAETRPLPGECSGNTNAGLCNNSINGGSMRLAYTVNKGQPHYATFSVAGRGSQLNNVQSSRLGSQWAASAAMNGHWGNYFLQLQAVDYAYNVSAPQSQRNNGRDTIGFEDYGYETYLPAKGQIYSINVGRSFGIHLGPFTKVVVYDNYSYLNINNGIDYNYNGQSIGNVQFNAAGAYWVAGPVYVWTEVYTGRNAGPMTFIGPYSNPNGWHTRGQVTLSYYF